MHKDRVWTPHPVQFRFGRNHGSGRDMEIQLTADEETERAGGFRAGTMRTLQLKRDVKMQLATSAAARPGVRRLSSRPIRRSMSPARACFNSTCRTTGPRFTRR